jgi:hypothetical protein
VSVLYGRISKAHVGLGQGSGVRRDMRGHVGERSLAIHSGHRQAMQPLSLSLSLSFGRATMRSLSYFGDVTGVVGGGAVSSHEEIDRPDYMKPIKVRPTESDEINIRTDENLH